MSKEESVVIPCAAYQRVRVERNSAFPDEVCVAIICEAGNALDYCAVASLPLQTVQALIAALQLFVPVKDEQA